MGAAGRGCAEGWRATLISTARFVASSAVACSLFACPGGGDPPPAPHEPESEEEPSPAVPHGECPDRPRTDDESANANDLAGQLYGGGAGDDRGIRTRGVRCAGRGYPRQADLTSREELTCAAQQIAEELEAGGNVTGPFQAAADADYDWIALGHLVGGVDEIDDIKNDWKSTQMLGKDRRADCAAVMNPLFSEIGVGGSGQTWVVVLGSPS